MKYIEEVFDNIKLEKFERDGDCIYDPIRSFLLAATPEECIRQKTIIYLQRDLGIPVNRIFVEESMAHTKKAHVEERILLSIVMMSAQMH